MFTSKLAFEKIKVSPAGFDFLMVTVEVVLIWTNETPCQRFNLESIDFIHGVGD